MSDVINGDLTTILNLLSAAAALGTAAMGLVDACKVFWGGPSNIGFATIKKALSPFLGDGSTALGKDKILATLKSNWINGVAKADQKAKAKSLIHLGLTASNAAKLAQSANVDGTKLRSLAEKIVAGNSPGGDEIKVLAQFDAVLSAVLDDAYERGDQHYRNGCKFLGLIVSTILGVIGGVLVYGPGITHNQFFMSLLVGVSSTPLAPIAKDLASSLQTAASAVRVVGR